MTMPLEITAKNVGPIPEGTFKVEGYGVTVFSAPNGSGKSILLDGIQKAAAGGGRVPLRDGAKRGLLDVGGAIITLGSTVRHTGEFQFANLEGKFDLATLVDPKLKSAEACDKQRIKALVSLMNVEADPKLFTDHEAFSDFAQVVSEEATKTDDVVEMARRVKSDYDKQALQAERDADREEGHAKGLAEAAEGLDLDGPCDAAELQQAYDRARDAHARAVKAVEDFETAERNAEDAEAKLTSLQAGYQGLTVDAAQELAVQADTKVNDAELSLKLLREELVRLESKITLASVELDNLRRVRVSAQKDVERANEHQRALVSLRQTIDAFAASPEAPRNADATDEALQQAKAAQQQGVLIREAKEKLAQSKQHKQQAQAARDRAVRLREAAGAVDEVLSGAIQCPRLRVESVDGVARLVTDHPVRGKGVPYHELSEGERWRIAIDLGADQVGENGVLVLPQEAFESLDAFVRPEIHAHAIERKVYVLTAEATRDPEEGTELMAKPFEAVA
jgi:hypothetical protein